MEQFFVYFVIMYQNFNFGVYYKGMNLNLTNKGDSRHQRCMRCYMFHSTQRKPTLLLHEHEAATNKRT
jgi:hypothetical protein